MAQTLDALDQPDATVAAVDLDGDGLLELVVGTGYSGIRALERTGAPRWTLPTAKYAWSRRPLAFELPDAGRIVLGTTAPPLTFYAARADTGALVWSRHLSEIQSAPYGILHRRRGPPIIVHAVPQGFAARHVATGEAAWPARKLGRRIRAFYGGEPGTPPGLLAQLNLQPLRLVLQRKLPAHHTYARIKADRSGSEPLGRPRRRFKPWRAKGV